MTHPALRPLMLALSIAAWPVVAAATGSGLYLDIPTIAGESVDPGHLGQIDVGRLSFGVSVVIGSRAGGAPPPLNPAVQDVSWTQGFDKSIVSLFNSTSSGQALVNASFQIANPPPASMSSYASLTVESGVMSSMQLAGGGDMVGAASISPSALSLSYTPTVLGVAGSPLTTRYDVVNNTVVGPLIHSPSAIPGAAPATAGLYLRLGSGTNAIAGESTAIGYENWVSIGNFSMGTTLVPSAGGALTGTAAVGELSWSQGLDATSPALLFDLLMGQNIGQVTIEQVALDRQGRPVTVMQHALNNVVFSSFNLLASGGDSVNFAGSMNFTSFTQTLWPTQADGSRGAAVSFGYDVVNGTPIAGDLAANVQGFGTGNLDPSATLPVPEPQSWLLLTLGLAGLLRAARLRSARA